MNAIEFVKKFGLDYAVKLLNYDQSILGHVCQLDFGEYENLKQIVDAYELVESLGGMDMAKDIFDIEIHEPHYNYDAEKVTRIEQAINLVEQCNA